MAQGFPRFCPRCGAAAAPDQRVCATCGMDQALSSSWQGSQIPSQPGQPGQPHSEQSSEPGLQSVGGPPPGWQQRPHHTSDPGLQSVGGPFSQPGWGPSPQQPFSASLQGNYVALPSTPRPEAEGRGRRRLGWVLLVLLILVVLGGAGYIALDALSVHTNTQAPITATTLNSSVTYAGVTMTILKVEQAQNFINDPNSSSDGMLRVHLQAQNKTLVPVNLIYTNIVRLIAPGGKTLTPMYVKGNAAVAAGGGVQTSIVDFVVAADTKVSQLVLQLGAPDEAQLAISLTEGANLDQYAPKTTNLTGAFVYQGLNWSLVSATTRLSIDGKQASKGMHYVSIALRINNPLSQTAIPGSAYDYLRLKVGSTIAAPLNTTLPVSLKVGATGTGTVTFLVPQKTTNLTLTLLSLPQSGFDQVTQDFQLP